MNELKSILKQIPLFLKGNIINTIIVIVGLIMLLKSFDLYSFGLSVFMLCLGGYCIYRTQKQKA